jgi:hypothetical protein
MVFSLGFSPLAVSSTDLIVPIGLLLWVIITQLAIFFIFLWKGGTIGRGPNAIATLSLSSGLGLVLSVISLILGVTPQPIFWVYDNQTTTFINAYMVPQAQTVDFYYGFFVFEIFLLFTASLKLIFESGLLAPEGGEE